MRDLTIEVTAKTTIDRESAERCLKMVEWYCNDNNLVPYADRDPDGKLHFRFEEWKDDKVIIGQHDRNLGHKIH